MSVFLVVEMCIRDSRCAYAADHGTPRQWTPPVSRGDEDARICGNCGTANPPGADVCACCGYHSDQPRPPDPAERQPPIDASVFYAQFSPYAVSYTHLDVYKRQAVRSGRRG